ncbi:dipeptide/oligopeptide/nickel ABC transporter permease/ATP-binding protein [Devosia sp. LjRoot3]|uniref:dipeptide/oligopeptide/nickel ABC transporter permease/ATP-binding protein n=1 Tax=Devosia sp. LjRoot3 TaxID=3342319 RepID=UPI003ECC34BD
MSSLSVMSDLAPSAPRRRSILSRFLSVPAGAVSLSVVIVVIAIAVFAPWLAPHDPNFVDLASAKAPPSAEHWLGGDATGRDMLSRLIWGARTTLLGALVTIITALIIGAPAGIAAGYFGGFFDRLSSWVSDALQAVPGMIILLVVAAGTRSNFVLIMATVGAFLAPGYFRIARSTTLAIRNEPFIDAARVAGLTHPRIILRHILPGIGAPIIIQTALATGIAMGIQAGLQFLGIGAASVPAWGAMMNEGFRHMLSTPLLLLWPSAVLGITIAALAVAGSTLADVVRIRTDAPSAGSSGQVTNAAPADVVTGSFAYAPEAAAVRVDNLRVRYAAGDGAVEVVHGISLDIAPGEVLGIVGESGSGKSQTVFSILDLLPTGGSSSVDGMWIGGRAVHTMSPRERAGMLGTEIGYIPQEPMSNLDPSYTIGFQLTQPLRTVHKKSRAEADAIARAVLNRVGIVDIDRVMKSYPHQISGGMAQRVLIAGAIAGRPSVLVADEPTTALDVTVQAEVLELLRELQAELGMALVLVTHNFGVVADICDRVIVMRDGAIVEASAVETVFAAPEQNYTRELIAASLDDTKGRRELDAVHAAQTAATA